MVATDHQKLRLLLKDCANGFYQQMYFLGKDVINARGNQLQAYGFKKSRSTGLKGTSCYTYKSDKEIIELYGSCAGYYSEDTNVVFLRKRCRFYTWLPEHKLVAGIWSQDQLRVESSEAMLDAISPLLKWWVHYEKWIVEQFGAHYREECFAEWNKVKSKVAWLPPSLAIEWVQEFLEKKDSHVRPKSFIQ